MGYRLHTLHLLGCALAITLGVLAIPLAWLYRASHPSAEILGVHIFAALAIGSGLMGLLAATAINRNRPMPRYRLRTLLIVLALGPPMLAGAYWVYEILRSKPDLMFTVIEYQWYEDLSYMTGQAVAPDEN